MINKIKDKIENSDNVVIEFLSDLAINVMAYDIGEKAASMTYYLALCIGPFMMVLLTILETYIRNNVDKMIQILSGFMQDPEIVIEPLISYVTQSSGGMIALFGAAVALFSASKAINNLINYMDEILGFNQGGGIKGTIKNRVLSVIFTLLFIISIVLFLGTYVYGDPISILVDFIFGIDLNQFTLWQFVNKILPGVYLFIVLLAMYKLLPSNDGDQVLKPKELLAATTFSTVGWIIASKGFQFYVSNFNKNNLMYGVLGNFMILLLWFYILMFIILLGTVVMDVFRRDYKYRFEK